MKRSYLTLKQMAEVLKISENELLELVKNKQIPFEITDEGTVYQAYRFIEEDVLKAFKPRETEEEETVKEPEPEKATEEEATPEPEEPAEGQGQPEEEPEEEATPEPEQTSEKTDMDPFEKVKEEEPKE
jgi:excisionase family DNA binding protein